MPPVHTYSVDLEWTGAGAAGTASYTSYGREHELSAPGKAVLLGSSDPAFRGDRSRWSPEDLLVAALAQSPAPAAVGEGDALVAFSARLVYRPFASGASGA
ncbi:OsmC family protein, partial [Cellulomonas sp.]|uniref:OsmC family protein n=1 Tax=Cellulomonas sp. TaxID=40001 RepID=UPI0035C77AEA